MQVCQESEVNPGITPSFICLLVKSCIQSCLSMALSAALL